MKIGGINRRGFLKRVIGGFAFLSLGEWPRLIKAESPVLNDIYWIKDIPDQPFHLPENTDSHAGFDSLIHLMGTNGLKFYRSDQETLISGPSGLIDSHDIVLIKVNAQWKYRGCTNSDVIRGLINKILDHPGNFTGEIVIVENGQGRGSLNCDTSAGYPDSEVHANANDESHSFTYLVNTVFNNNRVSCYLLDPIRNIFIEDDDHVTDGYRTYENVSYPCFTTAGGRRIELQKGIWNNGQYHQNLKLINVPVLKHHDEGGSEITASLKHMYGLISMSDGQSGFRHYEGLGETCGKMMVSVCAPVLHIMDAVWVSHSSLKGYPESTTHRSNQLMASQDPVALDRLAAKYILYPINNNNRHHPDFSGIDKWIIDSRDIINAGGGLQDLNKGILVGDVTKSENEMQVYARRSIQAPKMDFFGSWNQQGVYYRNSDTEQWVKMASPGKSIAADDLDGDGIDDLIGVWPLQGGVWVKHSSTGAWTKMASPARSISTGDMNSDGRSDLLGTWDGQGVYYRDSLSGTWVKMAVPATQVAAGDLDGDGKDDLIGNWPDQGGVWVKSSRSGDWSRIASSSDCIAAGDLNGNGRADLIGTWGGQGVFYRDSSTGNWVKMAAPALKITTGDLDGDGIDDLIGVWPLQGGVWVKYSRTGLWEKIASPADWITSGLTRSTGSGSAVSPLAVPPGGQAEGPSASGDFVDLSNDGPGGWNFVFRKDNNLIPEDHPRGLSKIPGPGDFGFRYIEQKNLYPDFR